MSGDVKRIVLDRRGIREQAKPVRHDGLALHVSILFA